MIASIVLRMAVMLVLALVLWSLPPRVTRMVSYAGALAVLLWVDAPFALQVGIALAVVHGAIHHVWPFIDRRGYNHDHDPTVDVACHLVMLVYAHAVFSDRLVVFR